MLFGVDQPPCEPLAFPCERRRGAEGAVRLPRVQSRMLLTIKELSKSLSIKQSTLYLWVKQGKIPCHKIHGLIRFDPEAIAAWLRSFQPDQAATVPQFTRTSELDLDRLIEAAKREVYTPGHGETITPSPTRKE
jgi:excisionase family DNA binding protein